MVERIKKIGKFLQTELLIKKPFEAFKLQRVDSHLDFMNDEIAKFSGL